MLVRSFTVNNISGPLLHAIRNLFVSVEYCHLLELYVKCAALYPTFIPSRSGILDVVVREGENST